MRCVVLKKFNRRGELQLPGSIIDVPEEVYSKIAEYVQAMAVVDNFPEATRATTAIEPAVGYCNYKGSCSVKIDICTGIFPDDCIQMKCEHYI